MQSPPPRRSSLDRACALVALGLSVAGLVSCAERAAAPSRLPASAILVPYDAFLAAAFDDVIEPSALGPAVSATRRTLLEERAEAAHVVARVRVQTVSSDTVDGVPVYHLSLVALGEPVAKSALPGDRVEIAVDRTTPAFAIAKAFDNQLVGRSFLGFFRWFSPMAPGDEPRVHWHLAPDDPDLIAAIRGMGLAAPARQR